MRNVRCLCLALAAAALGCAVQAAEPTTTFSVERTYDGKPFRYQLAEQGEGHGYRVLQLRYPSPIVSSLQQNNTIPAEYYLPSGMNGKVKRPAVVCLHILHGNFELERVTCSVLAAHGVAAAMIKLPYYGERGTAEGPRLLVREPELFRKALEQGIHDVRRTIDLLASRPEVDPLAIGLVGISMGGISAAAVAEREPRVARAALILAGGDLEYIIRHAHETRELSDRLNGLPAADQRAFVAALADYDPLRHADQLRARAAQGRVLMVNASEDQVIYPACTRKLAAALGIADRVRWLDGLGHYTAIAALPQVLDSVAEFFAQDLAPAARPEKKAAAQPPAKPLECIARMLEHAAQLVGADPSPGRGHLVDLQGQATWNREKPLAFRLRLVRGGGGRFRLDVQAPAVPEIGQIAVGQAAYPWFLLRGNTVIKGRTAAGEAAPQIDAFVEPRHRAKLQLFSGLIGGVARTPQIIEQIATIQELAGPAVRVATKDERRRREAVVHFQADRLAPKRLELSGDGVRIEIDVRQWQINTVIPDELFVEPPTAKVQEVDARDIARMCAAAVNFAVEELP